MITVAGKKFGNYALAIKLADDLELLIVADFGFKFDDGIRAGHGHAEMAHGNPHTGEEALDFRGDTIRLTGSEAEQNHVGLEVKPLSGPAEDDECEEHNAGGRARNAIKSAASRHADGRFDENRGGRSHSDHADFVFDNRPCAQETDALDDVGGDARRASVTPHLRQLLGKNRKESGGQADKHAGADAGRTAAQIALYANERTHGRGKEQPKKSIVKRDHAWGGLYPL